MKKIIIILSLTFFIVPWSISSSSETVLLHHDCPLETNDYQNCSSKCVHDEKFKIGASFKINVDKQIVMHTTYAQGTPRGTTIYENCSVIDNMNFICTLDNNHRIHMVNGIVYSYSRYKGQPEFDAKICFK
tara:strand:- start:35 stop:427 length:393 start_codon:yes stop_codon:yes gene_type:complete